MHADWKWAPCQEIQQAPKREKKSVSKLVALQDFNEELLTVAKEQHQQLGHMLNIAALVQQVKLRSMEGQDPRQKQPQQK